MTKSESKYYNTACLMDEALIILLEKKDYDYITIKEICHKAGVNRSTFYLHYETIDDLLKETIEFINQRFFESFKEIEPDYDVMLKKTIEDAILVTPKYLNPYLNFIKENKRIFKVIHNNPSLFKSEETLKKLYGELFVPILQSFNVEEHLQSYTFAYYTQGVLAIIMKWVKEDCLLEIEEVIDIIVKCLGLNVDIITKHSN